MDEYLLDALMSTADDLQLSRTERRGLRSLLVEAELDGDQRFHLQQRLVDRVAERMKHPDDRALVEWLGDALGTLRPRDEPAPHARAWFGPEDPMVEGLVAQLRTAQRSLDVAVFTITDDRVAEELLALHRRGVAVRILTDDDKSIDQGSDTRRLSRAGLSVTYDASPFHFHHKFAIVDRRLLITGSYNWTRGADRDNRENFLATDSPALVKRFDEAFQRMWAELGGGSGGRS